MNTSMVILPGVLDNAARKLADAVGRFKALQDALDSGACVDAHDHDRAVKAMYKARNKYLRLAAAKGDSNDC